jgi:plastocyanin
MSGMGIASRRDVVARVLALLMLVAATLAAAPATIDLTGQAWAGAKPVADVVVWIDVPGAPPPSHPPAAVLEQRDEQFTPRVLAVQVGTRVEFPNDDRVFHNVFSFHDGKRFDLGLYPVGTVKYVPFDRPGLSRIFCNIHPQMAAYVMAVDTPFFAVTDASGRFAIRGLPSGSHPFHAWRPGGPTLDGMTTDGVGELEVRWP